MPELPEVETVVRGLGPRLEGRSIVSTRVLRPDVLRGATPHRLARALKGRTVLGVGRRAKNIVARLTGEHVLLVNLGMTGRLMAVRPGARRPGRHPAAEFRLDDRSRLVFDDVRRFGTIETLSGPEWLARERSFGPEPLGPGLTVEEFRAGLSASTSPVRSWLLDQRRIAGVGNIYANEALFLARVHPARRALELSRAEAAALLSALRAVLRAAVDAGGTTLRDYRDANGDPGWFQTRLRVYGRNGEACEVCGRTIERTVFAGRSAFACPTCQPPPDP